MDVFPYLCLKLLNMSGKQELRLYLESNGKTHSWYELAEMFNICPNGSREQKSEAARSVGRRVVNLFKPDLTESPITEDSVAQVGKLKSMWQTPGGEWRKSYKFDYATDEAVASQVLQDFIAEAKAHAPKYAPISYKEHMLYEGERLLEISIFDPHLGKLAWAPEAGENYDIKIAKSRFKEATAYFMDLAKALQVTKILFVLGNDLFHTDGMSNTTTGGTPQDWDVRWQKAFTEVRKLMILCIDNLRTVAPVDVVIVPGNHDRAQCYYLGEALECWYNNCAEVCVDNAPKLRKYYSFGTNLLGFTHGSEEKQEDLPIIMATEEPMLFAQASHKEWHTGHLHKYLAEEKFGVTRRILPSIAGTDAWHKSKGYVGNIKSAQAYLYSANEGFLAYFQYNVS